MTAEDVIDALKMTFMGQIEARKGQWGLWSDLVYADLGGSKNGSRSFTVDHQPVNVDAHLGLDVKSTVWSVAGIYNLASSAENTTDLLFGARLLDLTWQVNAGVGYKFDWGSVFATYRYLDYEFKSGNPVQSLTMNGALVGVAFQF